MGTRALTSINGKPIIATHRDGYPSSLGNDLLQSHKSPGAVIRVAERHTIDGAESSIKEDLKQKRVRESSERHHLTEIETRKGKLRDALIMGHDHEICDLEEYRDWAEYQYDIRGKEVLFRPLKGQYPESLKNGSDYKRLTEDGVKNETEG